MLTPAYLPPGAGEAVWIGSFGTIYKVTSEATGGAVAIVEHVLGPKQLGARPTGTAERMRSPMCSRASSPCSRVTGWTPRRSAGPS
jgi:hypothetical protein